MYDIERLIYILFLLLGSPGELLDVWCYLLVTGCLLKVQLLNILWYSSKHHVHVCPRELSIYCNIM